MSCLACLILVCPETGEAAEFSFDLYAGLANGWSQWNSGYSFGAGGFYAVSGRVGLGGRVTYHRWSPSEEMAEVFTGSTTLLSLVPSVNIVFYRENNLDIFGQFGIGYFQGKEKTTPFHEFNEPKDHTYRIAGLSAGLGIRLGRFQILPILDGVISGDGPGFLATLTVGYRFGRR